MNYKDWYELRHKKDKTEQEELLLELRETIGVATEILVSYDKCHYSERDAINKIREVLSKVAHKL